MKTNKTNKTYCEFCNRINKYHVVKKKKTAVLVGHKYSYIGEDAICDKCNNEIYVGKVNDNDLKALYDVYRIENGIISLETVKAIPKKYNIGIRPLSKLLGWGELTYTRYFKGDVPSPEYSSLLIEIYSNPKKYDEILEKGKDLISDVAYRKSKQAVYKALNINTNKLLDVTYYIIYKYSGDITHLAIQKLLYYIQAFSYAINNEFMFIDDCEAWQYGPVYKSIYQELKKYKYNTIEYNKNNQEFDLTKKELSIINGVLESFGKYSPTTLKEFTHKEDPWKKTRIGLDDDEGSNRIIEKSLIGAYFTKIAEKYDIKKPNEICKYSNKLFNIL